MQKTDNLGVLFMRLQPEHAGHRDLIRKAKNQCTFLYIFVGSANSPRTIKNPFTFTERRDSLQRFLKHEDITNVVIIPLNDYKYSDSNWVSDVTSFIDSSWDTTQVTIFGHMKEGNGYLNLFPQYGKFVNIDSVHDVNGTSVRNEWFKHSRSKFDADVLADWDYFQEEKVKFSTFPYPETLNFCCGDVVLECAGHILLIKRKSAPGRNTWALPGGHKENNETYFDCAIRELFEETNVRIPEKVIRGSVVKTQLFDSPTRGCGIPRNTLAVHIKVNLDPDGNFPRKVASSDAKECEWVSISDIMNNYELFDDHMAIISTLCGVYPMPANLNPRYA
jgi:bifunctional NMN adenylyltransferase/nudix hydrolase